MKFELKRLTDYSDEALLNELRRVAELIHSPKISKREFKHYSCVHWSTLERRFGSWNKALYAAGLSERVDKSKETVTKEMVISELQRVSKIHDNKTFSRDEFNENALFSDHVVRKLFGTWHKAMQAAGMSTNALGKRYTDEECFENLLQVWTHHGRQPTHREMTQPPSKVGPKAYTRRWGTWTKALYAFVQRVDEDLHTTKTAMKTGPSCDMDSPSEKIEKIDDADRRDIRLGLRYTVLNRDRFKCVLCGNSPATSLECRLHVDHIIPFSKG